MSPGERSSKPSVTHTSLCAFIAALVVLNALVVLKVLVVVSVLQSTVVAIIDVTDSRKKMTAGVEKSRCEGVMQSFAVLHSLYALGRWVSPPVPLHVIALQSVPVIAALFFSIVSSSCIAQDLGLVHVCRTLVRSSLPAFCLDQS